MNHAAALLIEPHGWSDLKVLIAQRDELGFTRAQIASAMGVDYTYVGALERGASKVSARFRERYADALRRLVAMKESRSSEARR